MHEKLTDSQSIQAAIDFINDSINGRGFNFLEDTACSNKSRASDFVKKNDRSILVLSSFDFSYYHDLEMAFYDVSFTDLGAGYYWWDHWTKDQLELGNVNYSDGFEFRFNRGTHSDIQYIIRANGFSYHFETISYWR